MEKGYSRRIRSMIDEAEPGTLFVPSDFAVIGNDSAVFQNLFTLEKTGVVKRVFSGLYEKPRYEGGTYIPVDPAKAAEAVARSNHWTIVPTGEYALYLTGLIDRKPEILLYASTGPQNEYNCHGIKIKTMHRCSREIVGLSPKSALIVQALKSLRKDNVTPDVLATLSSSLTDEEKETMLQETVDCIGWVRGFIKEICGNDSHVTEEAV